jgi:hypothetical protein
MSNQMDMQYFSYDIVEDDTRYDKMILENIHVESLPLKYYVFL